MKITIIERKIKMEAEILKLIELIKNNEKVVIEFKNDGMIHSIITVTPYGDFIPYRVDWQNKPADFTLDHPLKTMIEMIAIFKPKPKTKPPSMPI